MRNLLKMKREEIFLEFVSDEIYRLYNSFWSEYEPKIRKLCEFKLQSDPDEIDDVVAQTFLHLWIEMTQKKVPSNVLGWLYTVAYNMIKQRYTASKKEKEILVPYDDKLSVIQFAVGYDIDNERLRNETVYVWSDEITQGLSEEEQMLYRFIYEDKLSMKEVAGRMGITDDAAKQRNYRLVRKLKKTAKYRSDHY